MAQSAGAAKADKPKCPAPAPPTSYFVNSQVDVVALLPPPPLADSAQQQADLQAVLAAQRVARAAGTTARAIADSEITCARFKDVLGPELKSEAAAAALKFVNGAAGSATSMSSPPKNYWKRPRPYMKSSEVARLADMVPDGEAASEEDPKDPNCITATETPKNPEEAAKQAAAKAEAQKQRDNTSYPSGHSTFGAVCGILLAEMIPEKRVELFARARQYGESREIVGAHYPSDVEAGLLAGTIGAALLMQNASFQRKFFEAQAELRAALNYPVKLPDLEPNKGMFKDPEPPSGGRGGRGGGPPPAGSGPR
jgi:acid phosphatase (class A)